MIQALVVGGRQDFVRDRVGKNLAKVGIEVAWHFDNEHEKQAQRGIPRGCELVVMLEDMTPGGMRTPVLNAARAGAYPMVRTTRKWSAMLGDLMKAGVINGPLPPAGEQLLHNLEGLRDRGLLPIEDDEDSMPGQTPPQLPVRLTKEDKPQVKTFDELIDDLKTTCTALMLAHNIVSIAVSESGIELKQERAVKVAL